MAPADLLALQRTIGNRAVRRLTTTSAALSSQMRVGSKLARVTGSSGFGQIVSTLSDYEKAKTAERRAQLLAKLDQLCTEWLKAHRAGESKEDEARRKSVQGLIDELPAERAKVSKEQAEQAYLGGAQSGAGVKGKSGPPGAANPFTMLTPGGQAQVKKTVTPGANSKSAQEFIAEHGLTEAEVAAIRIFTAADYTYMNPVTAGDKSSFDYNRLKGKVESDPGAQQRLQARGGTDAMKEVSEEGSLHSAMAMKGLEKIKPYEGEVYRGERHSQKVFEMLFKKDQIVPRNSLTSTTKKRNVAENFAHGVSSEELIDESKDVAVIITFTSTAGGSRDISKLTAYESEGEVVIMPGRKFKTVEIKEVDGSAYAAKVKMATERKPPQPVPKKWYEVTCAPVLEESGSNAEPPTRPQSAAPARPRSDAGAPPPNQRQAGRGRVAAAGHRLGPLPAPPK